MRDCRGALFFGGLWCLSDRTGWLHGFLSFRVMVEAWYVWRFSLSLLVGVQRSGSPTEHQAWHWSGFGVSLEDTSAGQMLAVRGWTWALTNSLLLWVKICSKWHSNITQNNMIYTWKNCSIAFWVLVTFTHGWGTRNKWLDLTDTAKMRGWNGF